MRKFSPLTDVKSVMSILSKVSFLGGVSDAEREEVFGLLEVCEFKKGEYILKRGEDPTHVYIIKTGKVDLLISNDGGVIRKRQFNIGDCFGEAAMLAMINNTASFVAAEDSDLIVLSKRSLNQLRSRDSHLFTILIMNLARELARKLQYTDEILLKEKHTLDE
jgi:CRP/FNR family cyclic AMP-dependent transcriptional regulator